MARKQYPLRIDPAIWEAVQRWADDEMRSANGQVEWILRDALKRAGRLPKKETRQKTTRVKSPAAICLQSAASANEPPIKGKHSGAQFILGFFSLFRGMYNRFCSAAGTRFRKMYSRLDGAPGTSAGRFFTTGR